MPAKVHLFVNSLYIVKGDLVEKLVKFTLIIVAPVAHGSRPGTHGNRPGVHPTRRLAANFKWLTTCDIYGKQRETNWQQGSSEVKGGRKVLCMQSARNTDFKSAVAGTDRLETVLENKAIN
jgi:hypothetical protein